MNQNINSDVQKSAAHDDERLTAIHDRIRTAGEQMGEWEQRMRQLAAVNPTDYEAVVLLSRGPQPMGAIADHLGLTRAAATAVVDRLERAGHAERHPDPTDRRRILVHQTESSERLVAEELSGLIDHLDRGLGHFSGPELAVVMRFLDLWIEAMTAGPNPDPDPADPAS